MKPNYKRLARNIVKYVQENSVETGIQLCVNVSELYDIEIDEKELIDELWCREEIADVVCEDGWFDVLLYTSYAPNYDENEYLK